MAAPRRGAPTTVVLTDGPFPYHDIARVDIHIVSVATLAFTDTGGLDHAAAAAHTGRNKTLKAAPRIKPRVATDLGIVVRNSRPARRLRNGATSLW